MMKLDKRDIQILAILQREGRITKSALAERVNLSQAPCWTRLQRLEQAGFITGYGASIDWHHLANFSIVFMQVELGSHTSQDFLKFEKSVEKIDAVLECWAVGGGFEYMLKVITKDIDDYQKTVHQMLNSDISIKRYYSYIVMKRVKESTAIPESLLADLSHRHDKST